MGRLLMGRWRCRGDRDKREKMGAELPGCQGFVKDSEMQDTGGQRCGERPEKRRWLGRQSWMNRGCGEYTDIQGWTETDAGRVLRDSETAWRYRHEGGRAQSVVRKQKNHWSQGNKLGRHDK